MSGQLQGKTAIVTGASRGIGRAITETFVREGARVFICGRKQDTLDAVAAEIGPAVGMRIFRPSSSRLAT